MDEVTDLSPNVIPSLPKFPAPETRDTPSLFRSILSLLFYLVAGFFLFGDLSTLLLITLVLLFHESGHFFAMRMVGYRDLGIFFIPLIGAYVSGSKRSITQRDSAIVTLAGPLPGILLGVILWSLIKTGHLPNEWMQIDLEQLVFLLIVLNCLNLLPILPLDGGQLLNRVFLEEDGWISRGFVIASAILLSIIAIRFKAYPLLIFPIFLLQRIYQSPISKRIERRIEQSCINTEVEYAELPDQDYWRIRTILLEEHPAFRNLSEAYANAYSPQEERMRQAIEQQLHRTLIQDLSIAAKLMIAFLWLTALLAPLFVWPITSNLLR